MKRLSAHVDEETGLWIDQEVADTKHTFGARRLLRRAREASGVKPKTLITDGLHAYHEAYMRECETQRDETRTEQYAASQFRATGATTRWNA